MARQCCAWVVGKALADHGSQDLLLVLPRTLAKTQYPPSFESRDGSC